jgi:hypothetical protein
MLLGHRSDRMAKALGDRSMIEKRETGEHARPVVLQGPRDTVKAGLLEPQTPGMERHILRHGMLGRCWRDRTVSVAPSEISFRQTTTSEVVQGVEQGTYVTLGRSILLRVNQNRSSSDNLAYIRWWSSVRWASWCQARSRQRRGPKGPGFTPA